MKILHVTPSYLPATRYGGPIYSVHALCRALVENGHHVEVFTTDVDGPGRSPVPLETPVERDGVSVTYFPTGLGRRLYRSPAMARAMSQRLASFDVVHLHSVFLWPTSAAASIARAFGVPYVLSPRGMLVASLIRRKSRLLKSAWISCFEARNVAMAAAIHATSQVEVSEMQALGLQARRYVVIPNGLAAPEIDVPRAKFGSENAAPIILFLGRINWKKGLDLLIPAMAGVHRGRLIVAGNDEENYTPQLQALADHHRVADRVSFVGPVHDAAKWDLLAQADVFALTSYSENFGNAVLEAMAAGLPVVVTNAVGLAEAVMEHGTGLVADAMPGEIAGALNSLLSDANFRRRCGENGQRLVATHFSWGKIASDMIDLYREVSEMPVLLPPHMDGGAPAKSANSGQSA